MEACKHNPSSSYNSDPETGDVYCFACKPPRLISKPRKISSGKTIEDLLREHGDALEKLDEINAELVTLYKLRDIARVKTEKAYGELNKINNELIALTELCDVTNVEVEETYKRWLEKKEQELT